MMINTDPFNKQRVVGTVAPKIEYQERAHGLLAYMLTIRCRPLLDAVNDDEDEV